MNFSNAQIGKRWFSIAKPTLSLQMQKQIKHDVIVLCNLND